MIRPLKPETVVPFLEALGVRTIQMGRLEASAVLKERDDLTSQFGSLHAAALFGVAECASEAILTKNFDLDVYTPLLKSVRISYQAQIFGEAQARAVVSEEHLEQAKREIDVLGRTDLEISVRVFSNEVLAAEMDLLWSLRKFIPSSTGN